MVANRSGHFLSFTLAACVLACLGGAAARAETVLIVSPARPQPLQVAFDVARLRSAFLVTYQVTKDSPSPLMHVWDGEKRQWSEITVESYLAGTHFADRPALVFLLGTETECPASIEEGGLAWGPKVVRITQLDVVTVFNTLDKDLHFATHEWQWLSGRYGLRIKDANEDRRRYGRYGPPTAIKEPHAKPMAVAPVSAPLVPVESLPEVTPAPVEPPSPVTETVPAQTTPVEPPSVEPVRTAAPPPAPASGTAPVTAPIEGGVK